MKHAREDYDRLQDPAGLIPPDEPVFLIRGQDVLGPATVDQWAALAQLAGASSEIVAKARAHAEAMRKYQRRTGRRKLPDLPG